MSIAAVSLCPYGIGTSTHGMGGGTTGKNGALSFDSTDYNCGCHVTRRWGRTVKKSTWRGEVCKTLKPGDAVPRNTGATGVTG